MLLGYCEQSFNWYYHIELNWIIYGYCLIIIKIGANENELLGETKIVKLSILLQS